jgi:prepilin peptidase CpaA
MMPPVLYRVPWIANLDDAKAGVPYGAAMAPAALLVFPSTDWLTHVVF